MASRGYTTKAAVEAYLGAATGLTDAVLDTYIDGVEKAIDRETGRVFKADATASARLYDGDGTPDLIVDDCTEVTKVEVGLDTYGGTFQEVAATGDDRYFRLPDNHAARELPCGKLKLSARVWGEGIQNARITAKWGYSAAVPSDVAFAACVFVAGVVRYRGDGGVKSESIGSYSVSYGAEEKSWADFSAAKGILAAYRKLEL